MDSFANTGLAGDFRYFITPDYVGHLSAVDIDASGLERLEREFCAAFPDAQHSIDDLIAEDDRVVLRTTGHATHLGEFQRIPRKRSPRRVHWFGDLSNLGWQDRGIWGEIDFLRLMRQLRTADLSEQMADETVLAEALRNRS